MSIASIEARAAALMCMHKEELTRALAHFEFLAGHLCDEVEDKVKQLLGFDEPAPAIEQGTDPEIIDVPAASTEPETLDEHGQWAAPQPPIDNDHVELGAEQFASDVIEGADASPAADYHE